MPPIPDLGHIRDPRSRASARAVLADMALCAALLREHGEKDDDGTFLYALKWAARGLGISAPTISAALRKLQACGAIKRVKVLPPLEGRSKGTRVYAVTLPPSPVVVEGRAAEVRQPVEPEPDVVDEPLVGGAELAAPIGADLAVAVGDRAGSGSAHGTDRTPTGGASGEEGE